ncbi:MAG: glutamate racemase [Crocinitomicaceae bacterium]|nr:glutamate racemase [Crocinitomicaceae bacterium]MDG1736248.1 glutamate racemase [Crocinitomicaceae bacterium]MDG2504837.1 glutamate racemase [Crocinitomicaceae bacterium]
MDKIGPIGVFDSGYGGLTVLQEFIRVLPEYDYLYLGDNARAPYGNRSFDVVHEFTLEAVNYLKNQGCKLVILACNTSSAKALRTIQQIDLVHSDANFRVLGVIRPSTETIGALSKNNSIGILGTPGTIHSESYKIELEKLSPSSRIFQHACPMWVPLIESNQHHTELGKKIIQNDIKVLLSKERSIDTILLACTHYPLILQQIQDFVGPSISVISQGPIVADKLKDYLSRNEFMQKQISRGASCSFLTTENSVVFQEAAMQFLAQSIKAEQIKL